MFAFQKQAETKSTLTPTTPVTKTETAFLSCIVCKKQTRPNSIFCSDDCIRRHAQSTVPSQPQIEQSDPEKATKKPPSTPASAGEVAKSISGTTPKTSTATVTAASAPKITFLKNKNRVVVMEKKTGRYLTGSSAPTVENLKQWLSEHPTFEIVPPNSAQAVVIKAKQQQLKQLSKDLQNEKKLFSVTDQKIQTTLKIDPTKKIILVNPHRQMLNDPKQQSAKATPPKLIKLSQQQQQQLIQIKPTSPIKSPTSGSPKTPVVLTPKTPVSATPKTPTSATPKTPISATPKAPTSVPAKTPISAQSKVQPAPLKTGTPVQKQTASSTAAAGATPLSSQQKAPSKRKQTLEQISSTPVAKNEPEPIRENVQRTLKAQLVQRSSETTDKSIPKLSDEEISKFAQETENEIFMLFNRDTGAKYRAKYRSLMFNIKDRKNQTLFHKICSKQIDAKQLVRMSAEEMASQELAMWRENETKHQLEMIKKSELDLLACAKSYVLKTHKGEEVIESKSTDRVTLDPSVSVEDVVSVLNNSTVSSTSENLLTTPTDVKDKRIDARFDRYLSVDSSSNTTKQNTSTSSTSAVKKKEARRSRSRSRDRHDSKKSSSSKHKRRRSRDRRSRSRERDKSRQDRSDRRDRSKEKDRPSGESSKKKDDKRDRERTKSSSSSSNKDPTVPSKKPHSEPTEAKEPPKPLKKEDNYNLIDKILEAQSTIDRILHPEDQKETEVKIVASNIEPDSVKKMPSSESDQEPSSTVTIPTPPETIMDKDESSTSSSGGEDNTIWTGSIIMVDLATFRIKIQPVSGDCVNIEKEFPDELDIVGRINPDTVWDYIGKIKKSVNKEILILRFTEESAEEREAYFTLYKYLYTRKRLGVIKTGSSCIKDFYVAPLAKHKSLPSILMPISGHGFENDRPDMLIGIIVKITSVPKRPVIPVKVNYFYLHFFLQFLYIFPSFA